MVMDAPISIVFCTTLLLASSLSYGQTQYCTFETEILGNENLDVLENTAVGSELGRYSAIGSVISISVTPDDSPYLDFKFEDSVLVLTLLRPLTESLDNGVDELRSTITPECQLGETIVPVGFVVEILDINNNPPEFNGENISITIQTPWPIQIPINFDIPINTTDADFLEENAITTFESTDNKIIIEHTSIQDDNNPKFTNILQLYLNDPFLQDVGEVYFIITAKNEDFEDTLGVTLIIEKMNVYPPIFSEVLYKTEIMDGIPAVDSPVVLDPQIGVVDPENTSFLYYVNGPQAHFVNINTATGQLTYAAISPADVEALPNGVAIIEVVARETLPLPLESSSTVLLYFAISGEVEQFCTFETEVLGMELLHVMEDTVVGSELGRFAAVGSVDSITVTSEHSEYLEFQYEEGQLILVLLKSLIESLDIGIDVLTATVSPHCPAPEMIIPVAFNVNITDINNKPPVFNGEIYTLNIQTPWPHNIPINFDVPIYTTDADFTMENALTIFESSDERIAINNTLIENTKTPKFTNELQLFVEDSLSGVEELHFLIIARNGHLEDTVEVTMFVQKLNIYPPLFAQVLYETPELIAGVPAENTLVILDNLIAAIDPENSPFSYEVEGPQANFVNIHPVTAQLTFAVITAEEIAALKNGVAVVEVIARESHEGIQLQSSATVLLYFEIPVPS